MNNNIIRELTSDELAQLHSCLLCILKDFILICDKYNLHYTLGGGDRFLVLFAITVLFPGTMI